MSIIGSFEERMKEFESDDLEAQRIHDAAYRLRDMLTVATIIADDVFHRPSVENVIAVYDRLENIAAGPLIIGREVAAETPFTDSPLQPYHGSRVGGEPHTIDTSSMKEDARWPADFASGASCIDGGRDPRGLGLESDLDIDEVSGDYESSPAIESIATLIASLTACPERDDVLRRFQELAEKRTSPVEIRRALTPDINKIIEAETNSAFIAEERAIEAYLENVPQELRESILEDFKLRFWSKCGSGYFSLGYLTELINKELEKDGYGPIPMPLRGGDVSFIKMKEAEDAYESGAPVTLGEVNGISITYQKGGEGQ